jgi:hypothetical protein
VRWRACIKTRCTTFVFALQLTSTTAVLDSASLQPKLMLNAMTLCYQLEYTVFLALVMVLRVTTGLQYQLEYMVFLTLKMLCADGLSSPLGVQRFMYLRCSGRPRQRSLIASLQPKLMMNAMTPCIPAGAHGIPAVNCCALAVLQYHLVYNVVLRCSVTSTTAVFDSASLQPELMMNAMTPCTTRLHIGLPFALSRIASTTAFIWFRFVQSRRMALTVKMAFLWFRSLAINVSAVCVAGFALPDGYHVLLCALASLMQLLLFLYSASGAVCDRWCLR